MLDRIKLSMRIAHNALDSDIESNIDSCMLDLKRVGVSAKYADPGTSDALIQKAAELYCKWQYDFAEKGEQYQKVYEKLRDALSLCDTYIESGDTDV